MIEELVTLHLRMSDLERRVAEMVRHGTVSDVDTKKGLMRLSFGEGDSGEFKGPWVPYAQIAGALKVHTPPSVGQQMTMVSPTGDMRQAIALPMTWSDANPSPGQSADPVLTYGDVEVTITPSSVTIEVGGFTAKFTSAGLATKGGGVSNEGKDIGASHTHGGVMPGDGDTLTPNPGGPPADEEAA